jgi:hypothetical protein
MPASGEYSTVGDRDLIIQQLEHQKKKNGHVVCGLGVTTIVL